MGHLNANLSFLMWRKINDMVISFKVGARINRGSSLKLSVNTKLLSCLWYGTRDYHKTLPSPLIYASEEIVWRWKELFRFMNSVEHLIAHIHSADYVSLGDQLEQETTLFGFANHKVSCAWGFLAAALPAAMNYLNHALCAARIFCVYRVEADSIWPTRNTRKRVQDLPFQTWFGFRVL